MSKIFAIRCVNQLFFIILVKSFTFLTVLNVKTFFLYVIKFLAEDTIELILIHLYLKFPIFKTNNFIKSPGNLLFFIFCINH